jgi:hypothetical protein
VQTFFCNLGKPDLGVCFAGLPILKTLDGCESMRFAWTNEKYPFRFNVEAFVPTVLSAGAWHKRRYNNAINLIA